jgi:hypothetical protein
MIEDPTMPQDAEDDCVKQTAIRRGELVALGMALYESFRIVVPLSPGVKGGMSRAANVVLCRHGSRQSQSIDAVNQESAMVSANAVHP